MFSILLHHIKFVKLILNYFFERPWNPHLVSEPLTVNESISSVDQFKVGALGSEYLIGHIKNVGCSWLWCRREKIGIFYVIFYSIDLKFQRSLKFLTEYIYSKKDEGAKMIESNQIAFPYRGFFMQGSGVGCLGLLLLERQAQKIVGHSQG